MSTNGVHAESSLRPAAPVPTRHPVCARRRHAAGGWPTRRLKAREGSLGVVAHFLCHRGHLGMSLAQQPRTELHGPVRQVLHRRLPGEFDEALVQGRARRLGQMQSQTDPAWHALQARMKQVRGPGYERIAELLRAAVTSASTRTAMAG